MTTDPKALIERLRAAALIAMPQCPAEASPALLRETIARIAALEAEVARLKVLGDGLAEALQNAKGILENSGAESGYCMCGDPVAGHSIGSGHSPVDSHLYAVGQAGERFAAALAAWETRDA